MPRLADAYAITYTYIDDYAGMTIVSLAKYGTASLITLCDSFCFQIIFVRPVSELGSLAQQYGFNQNEVVALTDRLE